METNEWILIRDCCSHYDIELTFIDSLQEYGLIEISHRQESDYIHENSLPQLEKFIRLHYDLNINLEGIDVILNLLHRMEELQHELAALRSHQLR